MLDPCSGADPPHIVRVTDTKWAKGGPSPNPAGRPKRAHAERADAWINVLAGINTARDKRTAGQIAGTQLTYEEMRTLWRHDDIAALTIETVPGEMFRRGFKFGHADAALVAHVNAEMKRLSLRRKLKRACEYERAYGGAAILPVMLDGASSLAEPLNLDTISTVSHLVVLEPRELHPEEWDNDILSPSWRRPLLYRFTPSSAHTSIGSSSLIHRSRLIVFDHRVRSNDPNDAATVGGIAGWGDSVLIPIHEVIRDFQMGWQAASLLLVDFAQGVYKMKGLVDQLKSNEAVVKKRLQLMDLSKSVVKAIVVDSEDEYSRQQTPISGLPETLDRLSSRVCAAARLPVTKLMGQSPKGLGNEGDSDIAFLYDQVQQEQDDKLPLIEQAIALILAQAGMPTKGKRRKAKEVKDWTVTFASLWQPTDKETAETRQIVMATDAIAIDKGVLSPDEVRRARYGADGFQPDLQVDLESGSDLDDVDPDRAKAMAADLRTPLGESVVTPSAADVPSVAAAGGAAIAKPSDTAMNGAQVTSLLEVIAMFNRGELSAVQASSVIQRAFNVTPADADLMIDEDFAVASQARRAAAAVSPPTAPPPPAPAQSEA